MSKVTGVLLCFSVAEDFCETPSGDVFPIIEQINTWLAERGKQPLRRLDGEMCTGKHPQMWVFGGGYNYLDDAGFLQLFHALPWQDREQVVLIFNPEDAPMEVWGPVRRGFTAGPS